MTLFDYPRPYRECLAFFEALRRLGFSSDDIYFMVAGAETPKKQLTIVLRTQSKEFVIIAGELSEDPDKIRETWIELANKLSSGQIDQEELNSSWRQSAARQHAGMFVASILAKGISIPANARKLN
ncbi:MAG: hypothetical protein PHC68_09200 [Syntrophorhabdaceae bacterium]|nr:hypothetical protein [Syntrophorhabdaceae bacterium]